MREWIVWTIAIGLLTVVSGGITVVAEMVLHRRKQERYDALHREMGLDANDPEPPRS
ncbi:MAG: hypothetical protein VCD00_02570 [Candidatus Hydrogenedentota bacterium]